MVGESTVHRTRQRYVEEGVELALTERQRKGRDKKMTPDTEAYLIATACSTPPTGRETWTMQLLADRLVSLELIDSISDETVRTTLKKNQVKPWLKEEWCIGEINAEYIYRMEDLLCLYAEYFTPFNPIVCFDERPYQLLADRVEPHPCEPGQPAQIDYQYSRQGVCNLFVFYPPHYGWRHIDVTHSRTKQDFAYQMKALVDIHFPRAEKIRVVLDNLNTHTPAALYETFSPIEEPKNY